MYFDRLSRGICAAVLAAPLAFATPSWAETVLRVIPHADLKNLDPIWTTAYISRNHGYMIYDTLFAMDEDFKPQPQMVDTWTTSEDGMMWTFVLRDGLMFHDGTSVTGEDVVASLNRWGQRDGMGRDDAVVAIWPGVGIHRQDLIIRALHHAKARGRNRSV